MPSSAASADLFRASSKDAPSARADRKASRAGIKASIIVLSPSSAFPRICTPSTAASSAAAQSSGSSSLLPAVAVPICRNSVPYRGPPAPPTRRHERHADGLEQAADVVPLQALELGEDGLHPAIHVDAVVGVPDRGVELREVLLVLGHGRAELLDPADDLGVGNSHAAQPPPHYVPHLRPGVRTGASHKRVSSSSSLSSVIDVPAISSDVM